MDQLPSQSPASPPQSTTRGRQSRRSRTGCWTCRLKKVKCDEIRPCCHRCSRLRLLCRYEDRRVPRQQDPHENVSQGTISQYLPEFTSSPCSLELTAEDHEAIRYFRTTFARLNHTKNPDFSVYSIIFSIAERQPLVMRMLLAVGGRDVESRRPSAQNSLLDNRPQKSKAWASLHHYAAALRCLADTLSVGPDGQDLLDLDTSFTLLYLMILYEQRYGDSECQGLAHHLKGAAAILSRRCRDMSSQLAALRVCDPPALVEQNSTGTNSQLSLYTARVLIWISLCDSAASTYGVGSTFNDTLHELLGCSRPSSAGSLQAVADGVVVLHTYSNPLFRVMWGANYPQQELLDDIENRSVFELTVCCNQVRHLLSKLALVKDDTERQQQLSITTSTMQAMTTKYSELLQVAGGLYPSTGSSQRLVRNLRAITPQYHAVVVLFARLAGDMGSPATTTIDPSLHIGSIVGLAKQSFRHGGEEAAMRVAWPLLVVALEEGTEKHHEWILNRFRAMSRLDANLGRVCGFLEDYLALGDKSANPWLDPTKWFRSRDGKLFVV